MPKRRTDEDHDDSDLTDAQTAKATSPSPPARRPSNDRAAPTGRRGRLTAESRGLLADARQAEADPDPDPVPAGADRWSTWDADQGERAPEPWPSWLPTGRAADTELGLLKTGKEADVHLLRREEAEPPLGEGRSCLLAAKRYRSGDHRMFHRDAGYLEGRKVRRSRDMRAQEKRTAFGRNVIAEQWASAEFAALVRLRDLGVPVPYPVQRIGTELLIEFLGEADGNGAPRLTELRPGPEELAGLWAVLVDALEVMAGEGLAHGDLSAFNILVHQGRLVLIDVPQLVDVVANQSGVAFLERDVRNVAKWFTGRGLDPAVTDPARLIKRLLALAGLG